jgi:hypothetical protein
MLVCIHKITKRVLEMQSDATPGTLLQNALNAGFALIDLDEREVTQEEYQALMEADPIEQAIKAAIQAEQAKVDNAVSAMKADPNWATWTAQQASDWINTNVTNLAQAKTVLISLAKAVVYLRDHSRILE